ncbi:dTDP-4-dehydrorhamnose 3,5-epimerase [Mycolicibacterium vaccae]|uniref:dTDP-4-dehydrorhamnose 3,5-epimerase n=1 Tax=Mycolicibacterium vaccae TaxID=1810 RepID=UPI003CFDA8A1
MNARELSVPGAWEITPRLHTDNRGTFFEWFTAAGFEAVTGHRFVLAQANCSVSEAGVLRGLHFAELPPSQAKYVTCVRGAVFDVVVDIRVGSPTFGQWDSVLLDEEDRRTVYLSEGLAHGFLSLEDDSTVMYLCSTPYSPAREHTILATDPAIGIAWPTEQPPSFSGRDAEAPTLADVRARGVLPTWADSQDFLEQLRSALR